MLPDDIAILDIRKVDRSTHAQYDAIWRTYEYYFHLVKTPQLCQLSSYYNYEQLDFDTMNKALDILKETKDFRSLCKHPDFYKNTDCIINSIQLVQIEGNQRYKLTVQAKRFLRGMIRYMMARILDIGTGKLELELFQKQLKSKESFEFPFHKQGHPQGLYLSKIEYDTSIFDD